MEKKLISDKLEYFNIGARYIEASLSKFLLPEGDMAVIKNWLEKEKGMLTFSGNPGIGKTYLCAAIILEWVKDPRECRYFSVNNFLNRIRQDIGKGWDYIATVHQLSESKWFILDDLGANITATEWQQEVIFELIDRRYHSELPTLITTNLNKEDLKKQIGERALSRLMDKQNIYMQLKWHDKRQTDLVNQ